MLNFLFVINCVSPKYYRAKLLPLGIALKTVEYLDNEEEYLPWVAAASELNYISKMLASTELSGAFKVLNKYSHTLYTCKPHTAYLTINVFATDDSREVRSLWYLSTVIELKQSSSGVQTNINR